MFIEMRENTCFRSFFLQKLIFRFSIYGNVVSHFKNKIPMFISPLTTNNIPNDVKFY